MDDASNLCRKHVQLVPKVILHTHNVQTYALLVYLWKKNVSHKFFFKTIAPKLKKNSRSKFFGKNWKKNFFQVWNLVNFFFKKQNFKKYFTSYFGPMKKYQVDKKFQNFEKKCFFEIFCNFLSKKNALFLSKKIVQKFLSNDKTLFRK